MSISFKWQIRLLDRYEMTNELVTAAFACDADRVQTILRRSRTATRIKTRRQPGGRTTMGSNSELLMCLPSLPGQRLKPASTDIVLGELKPR